MLSTGENLAHYRIISAIGAGGMGEVYLAQDTELERQVALKILLPEVADNEERIARFIQEAKAASALNHPNILTVYEIGTFESSRYIATEYIKGRTLGALMRGEPMLLSQALEIAQQVAAALCAAHEAGIIHRDIKPDNIMVRDDGVVKVLDFGLAKLSVIPAASDDTTRAQFNTQPGLVVGTVAYMSPEQARGHKLDARSDIFSLGLVMFELFTGKRPFTGEGHFELISSILKDEHPRLRQLSPDLPRQLERIVDKTLRKDRDHRYQHVRDLHIDIEDLRDELKFEAKYSQTVEPTIISGPAAVTNPSDFRSAFTTGISKTRRFTLLQAFIFLIAGAGLLSAVWYWSSGSGSASVIPGSYKITEVANWSSAPGELFSNASFSPDGKLIAFASTKSGAKNIWVTQTSSTEAIQITNDAFANIDPIWSPKGDEIAFFSERATISDSKTNATGVWRVSALGGVPRAIGAISAGGVGMRRWTQSGKIYYELQGDLHALDTFSGTSRRITTLDQKIGRVTWINISPDEKSIVFAMHDNGRWRLIMSDLEGANISEIAAGVGDIQGVVWLPDKNRFFYGALVDGVRQIFVTEKDSGQSIQITASEIDSSVVDAAPDGKSIIYGSAKEESNLWSVMVTDGRESPLSRDLNAKLWPAVSPDNEKVAFQSVKNLSEGNKLFESAIVVKSIKSRDESERPVPLAESGFLPAWSPDGSSLAFLRKNGDVRELFAVNANGGGEKRLSTGGIPMIGYSVLPYNHTQARAFAWSPDSDRIAYVSDRNGAANVWAARLRGDSDAPLTDNTDTNLTFYSPTWSEDARRLAYAFHTKSTDENKGIKRGLRVLDLEAGTSANAFESGRPFRFIGWTADGAGFIIAEPSRDISGLPPETVLKRVTISAAAETVIANLKNVYFYNIFLSDDKKLIAYAARDQNKDDIWVIPATGGIARKLTANNDSGLYYSRLAWLHDGSAIVFGKQTRFSLLSMITDIK